MAEKDLISQLKELKQIKPREEWVVLAKNRILGEEKKFSLSPLFGWKLAFAPVISVFIIVGLFGFAQNTIPGDFLFSVKKATESAQVGFSSPTDKPAASLKMANKRLEDLSRIAEANQVRSLSPTIEEFKANISEATKQLAELDINATGELIKEARKLEENKQKVESVLGAVVGETGELESALAQLEKRTADYLIADLEARTLVEGDQKLLIEAKELFAAGDYSSSLEKLWMLSNK